MNWSFGTFLGAMLVGLFWATLIWMFVVVFADVLRRDMSGWAKAGWMVLIFLLPFVGTLIYLIARPRQVDEVSRIGLTTAMAPPPRTYPPADAIAAAVRLHDEGKITESEFDKLKEQALSGGVR
jgi:hypothetical protein